MNQEVNLDISADRERIFPAFPAGKPRMVSFHPPTYPDGRGQTVNFVINVRLESGDVHGMIEQVKASGGIGGTDNTGVYRFIPWPCAAVEVRDA